MHISSNKTIFAARLRSLRKERGLTQIEVATAANIANSTLSQYESCKRMPDLDILHKFIAFYNTTADYLLGLSDQRYDKKTVALSSYEIHTLDELKSNQESLFFLLMRIGALPAHELVRIERLLSAYMEEAEDEKVSKIANFS